MRLSLIALFFLFVAAGCDISNGRVCTLVGCADGLTVNLTNPPAQAFDLSVVVNGETVQTITCPGGTCSQTYFQGVVSQEVTIVVETAEETYEHTVAPDYQSVQPNGPGCPPICQQATVTVTLSR